MLFADVMPAGVSFREAVRNDSGFKKINEKYYLKLKKVEKMIINIQFVKMESFMMIEQINLLSIL